MNARFHILAVAADGLLLLLLLRLVLAPLPAIILVARVLPAMGERGYFASAGSGYGMGELEGEFGWSTAYYATGLRGGGTAGGIKIYKDRPLGS